MFGLFKAAVTLGASCRHIDSSHNDLRNACNGERLAVATWAITKSCLDSMASTACAPGWMPCTATVYYGRTRPYTLRYVTRRSAHAWIRHDKKCVEHTASLPVPFPILHT